MANTLEELLNEVEDIDSFKTELGKLVLQMLIEKDEYKDLKRTAIRPLTLKNAEKAVEGEFIMDPDTAIPYTKKDGKIISSVDEIIEKVKEGDLDYSEGANYIVANNRFVYRFYYINGVVRLDPFLTYPRAAKYFRIRDINDSSKYYVSNLALVTDSAPAINLFKDNDTYFVEFYNEDQDYISTIMFTAKFAPSIILNNDTSGKIFSHIEITTNKNTMYVGEDPDSFLIRVIAHYDDGSEKDVTDSSRTYIDRSGITTDVVGTKSVKAIYIYDINNGLTSEAIAYVSVIEEEYSSITNLIVTPKKIITLNDGSKEIRLCILAYFDNGTVRDVSSECVISNNFDDSLFNEPQLLTIKFNIGHSNVVTKTYELTVHDDGSVSDNKVYYSDSIMSIDKAFNIPSNAYYYRIRHAQDVDFYYTPTYNEVNYDALYNDYSDTARMLKDGNNVIVEFYDDEKVLLDSVVMSVYYKDNL